MRSGDSKFLRRFEGDGVVAAGVTAAAAATVTVVADNDDVVPGLSTINGALLLAVARGGMGVACLLLLLRLKRLKRLLLL